MQHLNIGGTFITDESLFAIADSCPHLKVSYLEKYYALLDGADLFYKMNCLKVNILPNQSMTQKSHMFFFFLRNEHYIHTSLFFQSIVLWSCRHVTEIGLLNLVNKCHKLESINVWGTRIPVDCFIGLLAISPALQIKPPGVLLNIGSAAMWQVA